MWTAVILIATSLLWQIPVDQGVGFGHAVVRGTVRESHNVLPNAIVYATSETDAATAFTDQNGNFYFLTLLPGNYRITAYEQGSTSQALCPGPADEPQALAAGLEYTVTIWLGKCVT